MHILLETNEYLVLNKPAGISVHGDGKVNVPTLTDWILEKYPELSDIGEPVEYNGQIIKRPGIVHRLDKDTTGVMLIAKTQVAYVHFKQQFKEHIIEKVYHAFTYGAIKENDFTINAPIGRSRGDVRRWAVGGGARGELRDAETSFHVIKRIGVEGDGIEQKGSTEKGTFSFVECRPKTGRTHQIRVHLKSTNHPIVCDSLYAEKRTEKDAHNDNLGFERLALHARELSFFDLNNNRISVTAPYPADFERAVNR